jgi:SPASM domain peptide maturase of grasp-with-spasm system
MKILKFFSDCIITPGTNRAVIVDAIRNKYCLIPLSMAHLIKSFDGKELQELLNEYAGQPEVINEYLEYLDENEFIFWCDSKEEAENFVPLNTQWDFPGMISNAIVNLKGEVGPDLEEHMLSLQNLGCQAIKIKINTKENQRAILASVLDLLKVSSITSLEVEVLFTDDIESILLKLMADFPRLLKVSVFAAPFNGISEAVKEIISEQSMIIFTTALMAGKSCGQIHWGFFTTNIQHYTESLVHNTCLNRKIAIDEDGNIKNCPGMKDSFGNIKDTTLEEAINKPGFKKYWNITKDEITKCKDCEFRHICTDCRAYVENPEDIYSAPLKCGYDPYTCKWEEWSTNPLKQQAIEYYGMQE